MASSSRGLSATAAGSAFSAPTPKPLPGVQPLRTIPALDGVRGVAIIAVLAYHFSVWAMRAVSRNAVQSLVGFGYSGVDLFFVLSGFLITGVLLDARGTPGWLGSFYVRRMLRICPLYYTAVAVAIVAQRYLAEPDDVHSIAAVQPWLWTHTLNIKIAGQNAWSPYWLGHFWSLGVEEQFYLLWPTAVALLSRRGLAALCIAAVPAALGLRLWLFLNAHGAAAFALMPCRIDALCLGALTALAARSRGGLLVWWPAARAGIVVFGGATAMMLVPGASWANTVGVVRMTVVALFCTSVIIDAVASPPAALGRRLLETRVLRAFGKYSYGLYVIHQLMGPALIATFPFAALQGFAAPAATLAFFVYCSAVLIPIAWLSWTCLESPFLRLKSAFEYRLTAGARAGSVHG
jgi:peptidoglycan/LPS O-acetylase OafA/YrhL